MKTLEELRKEIDQIDKELHNLLVRRIEIGQEVAKAKKINSGFNPVSYTHLTLPTTPYV